MVKKAIVLLVTLLFWTGSALGCGPSDEYYATVEQLPEEIQEQLGTEIFSGSACRVAETIFVLLEKENDDRVLRIFQKEGGRYQLECESARLPMFQGQKANIDAYSIGVYHLKYENYTTREEGGWWNAWFLRFPESGTWRLGGVQCSNSDIVIMHYFDDKSVLVEGEGKLLCGRMETDISLIRIEEIPGTMKQAFERMDTEGYALVNSEDFGTRWPLHTAPDRDSAALGKYCSGTPVRVLEDEGGEWARVSVAGIQGYMLRECLAFGEDMLRTPKGFYYKLLLEEVKEAGVQVYAEPDRQAKAVGKLGGETRSQYQDLFLGMAGDEWYHVMFDGENSGYVEAKYFWDGNG